MNVIKAQLVAKENDVLNYTTYVFKTLETSPPFGKQYMMVTRVPNWDHRDIDILEIGYLEYNEVEAGKDTYFDRASASFIPYNYTNIYFIKFIADKIDTSQKKDIIL